MAKTVKSGTPKASRKASAAVRNENDELRDKLERQALAQKATIGQLAAKARPASEMVVGVRNVSDGGVALKSPFPHEPSINLKADTRGIGEPSAIGVVSYAWWSRLRKGPEVAMGLIRRDDSILGESELAAPADRPHDLPEEHYANLVEDPMAWIEKRTEAEIRTGLEKMTSDMSRLRVRRAADEAIRKLQDSLPYAKDDPKRAREAQRLLPSKYHLVERTVTALREGDDPTDDGFPSKLQL